MNFIDILFETIPKLFGYGPGYPGDENSPLGSVSNPPQGTTVRKPEILFYI